jgi:hypothetical protein
MPTTASKMSATTNSTAATAISTIIRPMMISPLVRVDVYGKKAQYNQSS